MCVCVIVCLKEREREREREREYKKLFEWDRRERAKFEDIAKLAL